MNRWNEDRPTTVGDYRVLTESGRTDMLRHWNGAEWSAPWYDDDPAEIADRARRTPAEPSPIRWQPLTDTAVAA